MVGGLFDNGIKMAHHLNVSSPWNANWLSPDDDHIGHSPKVLIVSSLPECLRIASRQG
jgi:hypothetical protein